MENSSKEQRQEQFKNMFEDILRFMKEGYLSTDEVNNTLVDFLQNIPNRYIVIEGFNTSYGIKLSYEERTGKKIGALNLEKLMDCVNEAMRLGQSRLEEGEDFLDKGIKIYNKRG